MYKGLGDAGAKRHIPLDGIKNTMIPEPNHSLEIVINVLSLMTGFGSASILNACQ
jgi:hypothetical protein